MAAHTSLVKTIRKTLDGELLFDAKGNRFVLSVVAGPINYSNMSRCSCYIDAINRKDQADIEKFGALWEQTFLAQLEDGLLAHQGPKGWAIETASPDPHGPFNLIPTVAVILKAKELGTKASLRLARLAEDNLADQLRVRSEFSVRGRSCTPAPRCKVKEDPSNGSKVDQWMSRVADRLCAMLLTGKVTGQWKPFSAEAMFAQLLSFPDGRAMRERMLARPFPKLAVPINKADLGKSRWRAWLEPSDKKMIDILRWVEWGVDLKQPILGYDSRYKRVPMPELPIDTIGITYGA